MKPASSQARQQEKVPAWFVVLLVAVSLFLVLVIGFVLFMECNSGVDGSASTNSVSRKSIVAGAAAEEVAASEESEVAGFRVGLTDFLEKLDEFELQYNVERGRPIDGARNTVVTHERGTIQLIGDPDSPDEVTIAGAATGETSGVESMVCLFALTEMIDTEISAFVKDNGDEIRAEGRNNRSVASRIDGYKLECMYNEAHGLSVLAATVSVEP